VSCTVKKTTGTDVAARSLKLMAALVWYVGSVVLFLKAVSLLMEASTMRPGSAWIWFSALGGVFFGVLKAELLFRHSCRLNLNRIDALHRPKFWQFFRPGFFLALACMIFVGTMLSKLAHNSFPLLISVATLDLSIAVALLLSSRVYWQKRAFTKK
jgi:hypothetical protein